MDDAKNHNNLELLGIALTDMLFRNNWLNRVKKEET